MIAPRNLGLRLNRGGVTDFLDPETGWLCDPDDAAGLAGALEELLAHPEEAARRSRQARRRVAENFDIQANIQRLLTAFALAIKA